MSISPGPALLDCPWLFAGGEFRAWLARYMYAHSRRVRSRPPGAAQRGYPARKNRGANKSFGIQSRRRPPPMLHCTRPLLGLRVGRAFVVRVPRLRGTGFIPSAGNGIKSVLRKREFDRRVSIIFKLGKHCFSHGFLHNWVEANNLRIEDWNTGLTALANYN